MKQYEVILGIFLWVVLLLMFSCGRSYIIENSVIEEVKHPLVKIEKQVCNEGWKGFLISTGIDSNDNNFLDREEIETQESFCYGFEIIDPCGPSGGYDEILLRMSPSVIVAYFQQGSAEHLVVLRPGVYITTDKQRCIFTIGEDYDISY